MPKVLRPKECEREFVQGWAEWGKRSVIEMFLQIDGRTVKDICNGRHDQHYLCGLVALLGPGHGGAGAGAADLDGDLPAGGLGRVLGHRLLVHRAPLDRPVGAFLKNINMHFAA